MAKKNQRHEIIIGLFVLIGIVLVIIVTVNLGTFSLGEKTYDLKVSYRFISGLEIGAPVKIYGTNAGEVIDISVIDDIRPVLVTIRLSEKYPVFKNARIRITQYGIMGEKVIDMDLGTREAERLGDGDAINGVDPFDIESVLAEAPIVTSNISNIISNLNDILGTEEMKSSVGNIVQQIDSFSTKLDGMLGGNEQDFCSLVKNLSSISYKLDSVLDDVSLIISEGKDDYIRCR